MRIATLCNLPAPYGGAEVFARSLARQLSRRGQGISILTHRRFEIQLDEGAEVARYSHRDDCDLRSLDDGIEVHPLFVTSLTSRASGSNGDLGDTLRSLWSQERPDVVHCHFTTGVAPTAVSVCEDLAIPLVMTLHGMTNLTPVVGSFVRGEYAPDEILALLRRCTRVVVVSNPMREYCDKRGLANVVRIPTGIDRDFYTPGTGTARGHVLYVGKRNRHKGLGETVAAYLELAHRTQCNLHLVGRGVDARGFATTGFGLPAIERTRAAALMATGRIRLYGEMPSTAVREQYRGAIMLVLPSWTEGFPLVVLEALACGAPVVASRVGAIPEVIEDGANGQGVAVGNAGELVEAILRVLALDARGLEERCRGRTIRYGIERIANDYERVFEAAAAQRTQLPTNLRTQRSVAVRRPRPASKSRRRLRIATVYRREIDHARYIMSGVRWLRMSERLAALGHDVDVVVDTPPSVIGPAQRVRHVSFSSVDWGRYDVVKTLFHLGFEQLRAAGGCDHPFIVSKLGSVVGSSDGVDGMHFFGDYRAWLFELQRQIWERSRYTTVLTESSRRLWKDEFGSDESTLLVPTGVDRVIPGPRRDPYREFDEKIAVYIGSIGLKGFDFNPLWQDRLNRLGRELRKRGVRLCLVGLGDTSLLDEGAVTLLGPVPNDEIWDYQYFADVGVVLALGSVQHNESSKIYYYLRAGLPVVCESPVPNAHLIHDADLGFICGYDRPREMAAAVEAAIGATWDRDHAMRHMTTHHTWDHRARIYDDLFRREFDLDGPGEREPHGSALRRRTGR